MEKEERDPVEINEQIIDFLEDNYSDKLNGYDLIEDNHLVIDFSDLIKHNPYLGEYVLDSPKESFDAFVYAIKQKRDDVGKDFVVRFKNAQKYTSILINEVRNTHINKLITVEGMVKQKSDVKAQITRTRFECPSCGTIQVIEQIDEQKYREPGGCKCGRKGKFVALSKETVPVFSLSLEEPTEIISGGTKLSRLRIMCKGGLTNKKVERMIYQGVRVQITGVLVEFQVQSIRGGLSNKIDWYLDANYVKVLDESFMNIKWTKEEEEEFKSLAKKDDWLKILRESIFYDIHGYEEECEGVVLQMFGGVGKTRNGAKIRGDAHIILVGDPGSAKSTILKIAQQFAPKSMFVSGTGLSGVGITAAVVKDDLLGGSTLEAGALVLCNDGLVCLDELDKVDDENKKALHTPLADGFVTINKSNISATLVARTSVLAAANPKHGSYSEFDTVFSQIDLSTTLINRFDLIYPIKESKLSKKDDYSIAKKILSRGNVGDVKDIKYSKEFIRKYISYAKLINPEMTEEVQNFLAEKYSELKDAKRVANQQAKSAIPVSARNVESFRRLAEAVARSRLHKKVTLEDAEIGYMKVMFSVRQMGIDPDSGEVEELTLSGSVVRDKDVAARIKSIIRGITSKGELLQHDELLNILSHEEFNNVDKIEDILSKLLRSGDIIEPRVGYYKVVV